jgi:integrase
MGRLTVTFGEVAGRYASTVLAAKDCKPATRMYLTSSLRMLQRVWTRSAGKPVRSITTANCKRWFDRRSIQVVAQRLNAELSLLKQVLDLAQREGVIKVNPAASLRGVRAEVNMARGIPTRADFERLIVMLTLLRLPKAGLYAEFLAYSGLRPAEAAARNGENLANKLSAPPTTGTTPATRRGT